MTQLDCERHMNDFRKLDKDQSGELTKEDFFVDATTRPTHKLRPRLSMRLELNQPQKREVIAC